MIHLKRFARQGSLCRKTNHAVNFPLKDLEVEPFRHRGTAARNTMADKKDLMRHVTIKLW